MAYDESRKKAAMKYIKNKQREIRIRYRNEDYKNRIKPAIDKSGLPTATFIKQAVEEKIERDGLAKADEPVEETANTENQPSDQITPMEESDSLAWSRAPQRADENSECNENSERTESDGSGEGTT